MSPRGWPRGVGALIVALGLLAGYAQAGINQWTSYGPAGGAITALAIDPTTSSTLYAGGAGVYKSTDGGEHWTATDLTNTGVGALAIDPTTSSTLYAGIIGGGVYKSTDGGQHWTAMNLGLTNAFVYALAIDPTTSSTLYAGTDGGGVYKSTDGGQHWTAINTGLTNTHVTALAIDPKIPTTLYAGTDGGGIFDIEQEAPILSVTPGALDFGKVTVDSMKNMDFTVQNTDNGTLTGTASATAPFSIVVGSSCSLTAGQSQPVTVGFSPTRPGTFVSNATFTSNGEKASPTKNH